MKRLILPIALLLVACQENHHFSIEILDDEALELIDPNSEIEVIGSGFEWTEGTLWIDSGNYLLFSDIPNNTVFKIDEAGDLTTYLKPSGYLGEVFDGREPGSNGLLLDPNGKLVLMQHGERRVARMKASLDSPSSDYEVVVDNYQGKRFNSPNDGVFDSQGNLYFTDPPYGLPKQMDDPNKELDFQGVYCLKTSGELILVDQLTRPNGIALSPDESKLYVAVSDPESAVWYRYDLAAPGMAEDKRIFYDTTPLIGQEGQQGLPDGMKMHSDGYLFATGPGGVWLFNLSGKAIARIHTGEATANCAFTTDEKTLFMAADDYVLKVPLK
ncbi:SMP-30/gluconolactonase/LRE family protein [Ulvibacterium sp.]|uniref:SMP-30/gluconolactonase/LRE family protein n=1 Tax=Ulvibacterium sp. TaxID=2665914 RepID=UPI003BABD383